MSFVFFPCMIFKTILILFLQTEALPQAPRLSIWIVAQRTLLPPFESNLKTRQYEYALDFYGHFFCSCVSMFSFFIFIYYPFSEKTAIFFFKQWLFIHIIFLFYFCFIFICYYYFLFTIYFIFPLFPRKFLQFKGSPWIQGILTFSHDYFSKKKDWNSMLKKDPHVFFLFPRCFFEKKKPLNFNIFFEK